ncbi:MAG TPA: leucyl aminopeptidase [Clostridiales bacterium]|nr:leucyl aminopeptidase [Clostridiales bacterium]
MIFISSKEFKVKIYYVTEGSDLIVLSDETKAYARQVGFEGKTGTSFSHLGPNTDNVIIMGLGKEEKINTQSIRKAAFGAGKILAANRIREASLVVAAQGKISEKSVGQCSVEALLHSAYSFDRYKKEAKEKYVETIGILSDECDQAAIDEAVDITRGNHIARDLVNTPSIDLYPETLARAAKETLAGLGVKVTIYDKQQIQDLDMKAFLAVGEGSEKEPCFIVMEYLPEGADKAAITLVGKGLTYDSGGYALKPAKSMATMKSDMAGAASVIGALYAIARQGLKKNVVGVVAACENMISGRAYKNGDIVGSMKGTTIEVGNTDAEGRLTLADAIYYAATKVNSEAIIDIATLTGACVVALGDKIIGATASDLGLLEKLQDVAELTGEKIWQLPLDDDFRDMIKGDVGDLKNSVAGGGGASTAAAFLEHFTEDKPWVHLDIAGPSWADKASGYIAAGGTGIPVKTLYNYVKRNQK